MQNSRRNNVEKAAREK